MIADGQAYAEAMDLARIAAQAAAETQAAADAFTATAAELNCVDPDTQLPSNSEEEQDQDRYSDEAEPVPPCTHTHNLLA